MSIEYEEISDLFDVDEDLREAAEDLIEAAATYRKLMNKAVGRSPGLLWLKGEGEEDTIFLADPETAEVIDSIVPEDEENLNPPGMLH